MLSLLAGLGILLLCPLIFHLIVFQRSREFVHVLYSILIGGYILVVFTELFGLLHLFNGMIILLASLFTVTILGSWIKRKRLLKEGSIKITDYSIALTLIFAAGIIILTKNLIPSPNDALKVYLPWARIIVQESSIPAFYIETNWKYTTHIPPLLYITSALLFSILGNYSTTTVQAIPVFYTSLTVFLLLNWAKEIGNRYTPFFTTISLFGIWPGFLVSGSYIAKTAPFLFFATSSFYFFFKYWETKRDTFLIFLVISSSLAGLTAFPGILVLSLISIPFFIRANKKEIFTRALVFLIFSLPVLLWILRNFYYYDNPFFPYFTNFFRHSSINRTEYLYVSYVRHDAVSMSPVYGFFKFIKDIFVSFPAFLFSFVYIYKNRQKHDIRFIFLSFAVFLFLIFLVGTYSGLYKGGDTSRHLFFFFGVFALYSGSELSKYYDLKPFKIVKGREGIILSFVLIFLFTFSFFRIYAEFSGYDYINKYGHDKDVLEYFIENDGTEGTRVFMWEGYAHPGLIWYGNMTLLSPNTRTFIALNDGQAFEYGKSITYYYELFNHIGVDYIYDPPSPDPLNEIIETMDKDNRIQLVFNEDDHRIWKL